MGGQAALVAVFAAAVLLAQAPVDASEKPALINALDAIDRELRRLEVQHSHDRSMRSIIHRTSRSTTWLRAIAVRWKPSDSAEARGMRESLEALAGAIGAAPTLHLRTFLEYAAEDLEAKAEHCRDRGLASRQLVRVTTKRGGVEEVKGLEVAYMEKFLEIIPDARPKVFTAFSSPATQDLVPGRYLFWARDPVDPSKAGPRREARISAGQPSGPLEVLAP